MVLLDQVRFALDILLLRTESSSSSLTLRVTQTDECPFLGEVPTGDTVQMMDNNLFRAPIVKHNPPTTDFLLVRSKKNKFYIREMPPVYAVGQEQPVTEVPAPNSRYGHFHLVFGILILTRASLSLDRQTTSLRRDCRRSYIDSSRREQTNSESAFLTSAAPFQVIPRPPLGNGSRTVLTSSAVVMTAAGGP